MAGGVQTCPSIHEELRDEVDCKEVLLKAKIQSLATVEVHYSARGQ
jgi:hypothetical protein